MTLSDLEVLLYYYRSDRPQSDFPGIVVPRGSDSIIALVDRGLLKRSDELRPGNDYAITEMGQKLVDLILASGDLILMSGNETRHDK